MVVITSNAYFLTILFISIVLVLLLKYWFTYWTKMGVETVSPVLFFGNTLNIVLRKESIGINLKHFYTELKRKGKRFGGYYFLLRPIFVPVDLELIKKILINDFNHFIDHIGYVNYERDPLSTNIFHSQGDRWKQLRITLTPAFTPGKIKMMFSTLLTSGLDLVTLLEGLIKNGNEIHIKDVIEKYTSDVVVSCCFGIDDSTLKNSKSEFQRCHQTHCGTSLIVSLKTLVLVLFPEAFRIFKIKMFDKKMTDFFINMVQNIVKYREENNVVRKDFMHLLIQIKNNVKLDDNEFGNLKNEKNNTKQVTLTLNEMAAQCFIFYMAGYETSATTICFSLFELAVNPEIQDKLRAEINSMLENNNDDVTYDGIMKMDYLDKCVAETLRKYPPVPVHTRLCTKTYAIPNSSVVIKKGMSVLIPLHAIHHDPEYYPNPDNYDPERFSDEDIKNRNPYVYSPFGIGPRKCVGYAFGILQVKLALIVLLGRFKFSLHPDTKPQIQFNATTIIANATPPIKLIVEKLLH